MAARARQRVEELSGAGIAQESWEGVFKLIM
jgi:hypothetical protein